MKKFIQYFKLWIGLQLQTYNFLVLKMCKKISYDGMLLYTIEDDDKFFDVAKQALDLIKEIDYRKYKRVKKYLKSIAFVQLGSDSYMLKQRSYFVDVFPEDVEYFASSIIHEATHGYLHSKGFLYIPERQEQHERICTNQQFKFLEKLILSKKDLSEENREKEIYRYKEFFDKALQKQWWNEKVLKERKLNRLKSFLKKTFIRKTHYINGELESEVKIVNGKMNGFYRVYYQDGRLKEEGTYSDDKIEGLSKHYYPNGKMQSEAHYVGNKQDGDYKIYFEDGSLMQEGTYKNGQPHGCVKWYRKDGSLQTEAEYENGNIIGDPKHY